LHHGRCSCDACVTKLSPLSLQRELACYCSTGCHCLTLVMHQHSGKVRFQLVLSVYLTGTTSSPCKRRLLWLRPTAPKYLWDSTRSPFYATSLHLLCSLDRLWIVFVSLTMVKSRYFTVIGPSLWNRLLPASRQLSSNLSTTPALLKTCLFSRS